MLPRPPTPTLFPYTTLFRSEPDYRLVVVFVLAAGRRFCVEPGGRKFCGGRVAAIAARIAFRHTGGRARRLVRSEEHTSELQSQSNLVCRLLLEKKKQNRQVE